MTNGIYVLQVETGAETRVVQQVKRDQRVDFSDRSGLRLWWPRRKLRIRRRGRRVNTVVPLFPGYLFLEAPKVDESLFAVFRSTRGFYRFLRDNRNIEPLSGTDLETIRHFLSFGEVIERSTVSFDENNRIVVRNGPLKGLEGLIIKVDKRKRRAKVKLDLYENSFTVDLGFDILEGSR